MAQRRVLIASDLGGHRELVGAGVYGVRFQTGKPTSLVTAGLDLMGPSELQDQPKQTGLTCGRGKLKRRRSLARHADAYTSTLHSPRPLQSPERAW